MINRLRIIGENIFWIGASILILIPLMLIAGIIVTLVQGVKAGGRYVR